MNKTDVFEEQLSATLKLLKQTIHKQYSDLSIEQVRILMNCLNNNNVTASFLADKLNVTLPAIMHKLTILESKGYIYKDSDDLDRRVKYIKISDKTRYICEDINKQRTKFLEGYLDYLGEEDALNLYRIMNKMKNYIYEKGEIND